MFPHIRSLILSWAVHSEMNSIYLSLLSVNCELIRHTDHITDCILVSTRLSHTRRDNKHQQQTVNKFLYSPLLRSQPRCGHVQKLLIGELWKDTRHCKWQVRSPPVWSSWRHPTLTEPTVTATTRSVQSEKWECQQIWPDLVNIFPSTPLPC